MNLPKGKLGTARLSAKGGGLALVLADGKPPAAFRIFRAGVNESDYGPITFDDAAAAMVMQSAKEKGNPFFFDFNHGMAVDEGFRPTDEQAKAAGMFTPEIRDGELWATGCQYTENGAARLTAREYNLFSPYFRTLTGADGIKRPFELLNVAFVNLAGLNDLQAIAASASATHSSENDMTPEEIKRLQDRNATLEAEIAGLRAASNEVVALGGTLALGASAGPAERTKAVTGLLALRADLLKITGQATDAGAVGIVESWKEKAGQADGMIAAAAKAESDAIATELNTVLDDGIKAAKIAPADREIFEAAALAKGAGKPSKEGVLYLRARIDGRQKQVSTEATGQKKETQTIAAAARVVGAQMGIDQAEYELFRTDRPAWEANQLEKKNGTVAAQR